MTQSALQTALNRAIKTLYPDYRQPVNLDKPTKSQFGDFTTTGALALAKYSQQKPMDIAKAIVSQLEADAVFTDLVERTVILPPGFINLTVSNAALFGQLPDLQAPLQTHPDQPGRGQAIMVEFSSPNIAKPFNVGHLRSTIIGDSLANLFQFLGYKVIRDNHLGDWGTQYGKLAYAVEQWGDWAAIEANPIPELFKLYVRINDETKDNPDLQEAAREYFKKLEQGDPHVRQLWQKLSDLSLVDFGQLYQQFNIHFDVMLGESFYEPYLADTIQACVEAGIAQESQGALVIFPPGAKPQDPPVIIRKSNGTSTYDTRDLAGIRYRFEQFHLDRLIIEIGNEQEFYFRRIIAIAEQMKWVKPGQIVHVGHGLFLGASGKRLATRTGETIWLRDLVKELEDKATQIVADKSPDLDQSQRQQVAQKVAISALKYNDLSQNRLSNIVFDKDKALSLDGNSAPYLQYTVARGRSVLHQATGPFSSEYLEQISPAERALVDSLNQFYPTVETAAKDYLPNLLATYLFQTAQKFNTFYQLDPILKAEPPVTQRRLAVTQATVNVLTAGLQLLGVSIPERM
jgi:arginyl-tRNA synthetase